MFYEYRRNQFRAIFLNILRFFYYFFKLLLDSLKHHYMYYIKTYNIVLEYYNIKLYDITCVF